MRARLASLLLVALLVPALAGGRNQIFVVSPDDGEAVQLTKAENGVNEYAWSRDGRRIAYTALTDRPDRDLRDQRW